VWPPSDASAQTGPAPPTNVRLVSPVVVPPSSGTAGQQIGGWRFPFDYQRGSIAIDFSRMKLWMVGHAQRQEILEYDLPAMGAGSSESNWPVVFPSRTIPRFWGTGYAHGLCYFRGKLWASPRVFYDQPPQSEEPLTICAEDGTTIALPYKRQIFSGFVKRGPGLDPFIGGGGYESGQGTSSGPALATLGGQVIIQYGWPGDPGPNLEYWNQRAPRDPNYSNTIGFSNLADATAGYPGDSWVGWLPRTINGELQGRWASDRIYGGGLVLSQGVTFWAWMGTGVLDYRTQTYTFAYDAMNRTYEYRYTPQGQFVSYQARPDLGVITGQEIGPDGKTYLVDMGLGWLSGPGTCVLKVFA
jgi:hypothetical protein